jgi:hypothetical protein
MPLRSPDADGNRAASVGADDEVTSRTRDLTADEREWLAYQVSRAAEKAFPVDEKIGKTHQQHFYFRELLEILIGNVLRQAMPISGGTYAEIWQFTRSLMPQWRAEPTAVRGRSGYSRQSIKVLVHEWKAAFNEHSRSVECNPRGSIEFVFEPPGPETDDLVLRAEVRGLVLPSGATFDFQENELSSATRLPSAQAGTPSNDEEKARLLREARKYLRRVETEYLSKLSRGPIEFIEDEVSDLRRHRNNHRKIAAAVLGIITAGMIGYQVLRIEKITTVVDISPNKNRGLTSIVVDRSGRIALADGGNRTSEWAHKIVDGTGQSMRVKEQTAEGALIELTTKELVFEFGIPKRWHEKPEVVLDREGSCQRLINPSQGILCVLLIDVRAAFPTATTADGITFVMNWGDDRRAHPAPTTRFESIDTRVLLNAQHGYARDGTYDVWLFLSDRPQVLGSSKFDSGSSRLLPVARFTWKGGKLVAAERNKSPLPDWMLTPAELAQRTAHRAAP